MPLRIDAFTETQMLSVRKSSAFNAIRGLATAVVVSSTMSALSGCGKSEPPVVRETPDRPLGELRLAMRHQKWADAWQYADAVLETHPDDADAIASVAQVAQHLEKPNKVADLLVKACIVESFGNDARVRQAMIALVGAGRLYDAIDLLEQTIRTDPARHDTRRLLYDLYVNSGNQSAATPHGRTLVLARQFDAKLLLSLGIASIAKDEPGSTLEMVRRNPDDKRPLLRQAITLLNSGQIDEARAGLQAIIDQHPEFIPAQTRMGLVIAESGNVEAFKQWEAKQDLQSLELEPDYWAAKAKVAITAGNQRDALRFYWNAAQRNPDRPEYWTAILELLNDSEIASNEKSGAIEKRLSTLDDVRTSMKNFDLLGSISRRLATDIAIQLEKLGRLWEAEAWASLATTLPRDDSVKVDEVRAQIVKRLRGKPQWQVTEGHPELQLELPNEFQ
ncbi:MAG: tetratricopeptide repeat protein [Rhodopirellula sp. JB055]|uniref:tetratricopeptide repeat protein n=1 Tax=Rhodopirellula sp. JB055 TaxID=3342846 RepID=UPI00370C5B12